MDPFQEKPDSVGFYILIYVLLMILLVGTVVASGFDLDQGNVVIALTIAVIKAILVILFFMHVRHNTRLTWVFAGGAFVWLTLMLGLTMTDYTGRGKPPYVPGPNNAQMQAQEDIPGSPDVVHRPLP